MKGVLVLLVFFALLFVLALFSDNNRLGRTQLIYTRNVSILCIFVYLCTLSVINEPKKFLYWVTTYVAINETTHVPLN